LLLFAQESVGELPKPRTIGLYPKLKAASIGELYTAAFGLGFPANEVT
jgi:hypothetical protein